MATQSFDQIIRWWHLKNSQVEGYIYIFASLLLLLYIYTTHVYVVHLITLRTKLMNISHKKNSSKPRRLTIWFSIIFVISLKSRIFIFKDEVEPNLSMLQWLFDILSSQERSLWCIVYGVYVIDVLVCFLFKKRTIQWSNLCSTQLYEFETHPRIEIKIYWNWRPKQLPEKIIDDDTKFPI